jgi:hypothetical protein
MLREMKRRPASQRSRRPYQPYLVVRQRSAGLSLQDLAAGLVKVPDLQEVINQVLPGAEIEPLFQPADSLDLLGRLVDYHRVKLPLGELPARYIEALRGIEPIELVYEQGPPTQPPLVEPLATPDSISQGYLDPAPNGIDAEFAWRHPGGSGKDIKLIDIEQGWELRHSDLPAGVRVLAGTNLDAPEHGTAVLGIVGGVDNGKGVVGIAHGISALHAVSQWLDSDFCTARAIHAALPFLQAGDVLLLEAQTTAEPLPSVFPVEVEPAVQEVIRVAVSRGITVVEAAGNGANGLDDFDHPDFGRTLDSPSGAILVGGALPASRRPIPRTNRGRCVDCFAWGRHVATTGGEIQLMLAGFTRSFSGTSAAAAIVAGAAVVVQGIVKAHGGEPLSPGNLRNLFRDTTLNTPSANPATDLIGVMPDLKQIIGKLGL